MGRPNIWGTRFAVPGRDNGTLERNLDLQAHGAPMPACHTQAIFLVLISGDISLLEPHAFYLNSFRQVREK